MLLLRQAPTSTGNTYNDSFVQIFGKYGVVNNQTLATETKVFAEPTFFLLLGLFAAASFQLLLQNPLLCYLRGVGSAQSGHQPCIQELGQVPTVKNKRIHSQMNQSEPVEKFDFACRNVEFVPTRHTS